MAQTIERTEAKAKRAQRREREARAREHAALLRMLYGDAFTPAEYRRAGRGVESAAREGR